MKRQGGDKIPSPLYSGERGEGEGAEPINGKPLTPTPLPAYRERGDITDAALPVRARNHRWTRTGLQIGPCPRRGV